MAAALMWRGINAVANGNTSLKRDPAAIISETLKIR
jgi:hypothetical protein